MPQVQRSFNDWNHSKCVKLARAKELYIREVRGAILAQERRQTAAQALQASGTINKLDANGNIIGSNFA